MLKVRHQNTQSFSPHIHSIKFHIHKFGATNIATSDPPSLNLRHNPSHSHQIGATETASMLPSSVWPTFCCQDTQNRNFRVWVSVPPSLAIWLLVTFSVPPSSIYWSHRDSKVHTFSTSRYHRVVHFGVTEFALLYVTVEFWLLPIYTPSPTSYSWEKHS